MAKSIIFYAAPKSNASPVACMLRELDVPHERIEVNLAAGDQKKPEYLAINPNGRVPALVVDGTPMFEAVAIMQWLADRYGVAKGLWPAADAPARLEAMSWSTWAYVQLGAAIGRFIYAGDPRVPHEYHNAALAKATRDELHGLFGLLDARLERRPFMLGNEFSLTDLIVGCAIQYTILCGITLDDHEPVRAWLGRTFDRPSLRDPWI
jgi:glutathione S-transferase